MPAYLGIDLGTQSLKVLLLDAARGVLGTATEELEAIANLPAGHSEQDPEAWLEALRAATRRLLEETGIDPSSIAALGVSGQQHGLVPLDRDLRVIRPAKLWNDLSAAPQCRAVREELGEGRLFALTGNVLPPGFTGGKIRWLFEKEPKSFERLALILLPHDFINLYLTGQPSCEDGDASGTGFFDVRERRFAPEVMAALAPDLARRLPPRLAPGEPAGELRAKAASELGLAPGTLVSCGSGDNMMAALGSGAVRPGVAVMSLGTSGTVFACADAPVCDPGGEIAAFCDATGHWLPLGCTMNATVSTELTRRAFGLSLGGFEDAAARVPPGAGGILCLPFFTGERSPDLPQGTGAFVGLTPANFTKGHLARAAMEGATFALARLFFRLETLGLPIEELRLTGGGSRSALWRGIVAAVLGRQITTGICKDAAALGAAVHACWTERKREHTDTEAHDCVADLGLDAGLRTEAPDAEAQARYAERREVYERMVSALTPHFGAIHGS